MNWEIASLNKMHKTKDFRKIKFCDFMGREFFTLTSDTSSSNALDSIKEDQIKSFQNEKALLDKYGCSELLEETKDAGVDFKLLFLFDGVLAVSRSVNPIDQETEDRLIYWAGFLFKTGHSKGTSSTTLDDAKDGLIQFNQYLALRSCVIGHSLSAADVISASAIRQNENVWSELENKDFLGFENIKRWYDWIEGIGQISWSQINGKNNKSKDKKSKKTHVKFARSNELLAAVKTKNIKKAREILEESPISVITCDTEKKKSLAHIAGENEDLEMLKLLVEFKINLESMTSSGKSVIYYAIERKSIEIIKYLIGQKVNLEHSGHQNRTPLYMAALKGSLEAVKLFIEAGSNPDAYSRFRKTAITKACWDGYADIVECLLETGKINVNFGDYKGVTALHNAVWGRVRGRNGDENDNPSQGSYECAKLLLEHGADPNVKDEAGNTPLHTAGATNGVNCIKLLISYGADINSKNGHGATPLLSACLKGYSDGCKVLYEYDELDPFVTTKNGYRAFEYGIEDRKGRILDWIIEEKLNYREYPGLEIDSFDSTKMLHLAVHNPNTPHVSLSRLLEYYWKKDPRMVTDGFLDVLNRAILKKSALGVQLLIDFYTEKELSKVIKFNEVLLEASIHLEDKRVFKIILKNYEGDLPQIALQTTILLQNESLLRDLLVAFLEQFKQADNYNEISEIPKEFTKIIDDDILANHTYFEKVSHPIFSHQEKCKHYTEYNPLQLAVHLDNSKMVKLILDLTCYKASTPLKNGDNIIHLMVSQKSGDSFILQKLLQRLELEVGGKENVKKDFLLAKSDSDGLTTLEYGAGSKVHASILHQYSSVIGVPEEDLCSQSKVLDVEFINNLTEEEEEKIDKKASACEIKAKARIKYKELIDRTEELSKQDQFVFDFANEIGLDLAGMGSSNNSVDISFIEHIPKLKDKPCKFIDNLEELTVGAEEMKKHKVLGVDLEFTGDKRIGIASLIQISSIECDYVVDALVLREKVGPILSPVFGDPLIVKVFHGGENDIQLLLTDLEISILNVFDTARALKGMLKVSSKSDPQLVSFKYLVESLLGVEINKFCQVAEWQLRPLSNEMMNYCRADSHFLLFVYAILIEFMKDSDSEVAVSEQTYEENKGWIEKRKEDKYKWERVIEDFKEVMGKFMIQRIEKAGPRNYQVVIHDHH